MVSYAFIDFKFIFVDFNYAFHFRNWQHRASCGLFAFSIISFGCIEGSVPDRFASSLNISYIWRDFLVHVTPKDILTFILQNYIKDFCHSIQLR